MYKLNNQYSTYFDKEEDFENAFISKLINCGWEKDVISYPTEEDLLKNWADILYNNNRDIDRLADYPLTDSEMQQIIDQITTARTPFKLNEFINGQDISIKRDNPNDIQHLGKEVRLHIYNRQEIAGGKSRYQIVKQPKFKSPNNIYPNRRGDVMLLINGMPVFHIELKKSGIPITEAQTQIKKYSKQGIFNGLFSLIQIFIAMTPDDAVYYTNPGPEGEFNQDFYFRWEDFDNRWINAWEEFTQNLLYIPMAHELIGFYTVADGKDGNLKVLRSYQYYAVSAISNKTRTNRWDEKKQRGGYIWHTTGSGKTLTSFKAADHISKTKDADKVVFLVDRKELDTQSVKNYQCFADDADSVQKTENTDMLISKLKSDNSNDTLIVTSIQKMCRIFEDGSRKKEKDIALINKKRIVFIVDECHRDTFGDMMSTVKETFPYALFFGFTGTPIQEENRKKGCTSADVFGDELHRYTIGDGIRDKNVLPFDPCKISTFRDSDLKREVALKKVNARSESEAISDPKKSDKYFELLNTLDMAGCVDKNGKYVKGVEDYVPSSQYREDTHINAVIGDIIQKFPVASRNMKFHSIFATSSIPEAIEYYNRFKNAAPHIKTTVLVDPSDNNTESSIEKIDGLVKIIEDYNNRYGMNFSITTYDKMKTDISQRLSHAEPYKNIDKEREKAIDMLIVVNQMLTGFDSKWINTLYLDKLMKQENIIQAISRTNRIFSMIEKPHGQIYYYRYPHTMERNINEAIKLYSGDKEYMVYVDKLEKNLNKLNDLYADIKELFENEDIEDFSKLPDNTAVCAKFAALFCKLAYTLETAKVQGFVWSNDTYDDIIVQLTKPDYQALLQRYKELQNHPTRQNSNEPIPYDIDAHISEISTGKIDADYMNTRFQKFLKLKYDGKSKELIKNALQELYKSFAMLPEEEQKFAEVFIRDVQLGNIVPEADKTFRDYVTEYMCRDKDDKIHRFATAFTLDEKQLRDIMSLQVTDENINEFGRFNKLSETADKDKIVAYFNNVPAFLANFEFMKLLREFILSGGFEI